MTPQLIDKFGRIHNYLRLSLTDRCNLRCTYCNPLPLETTFTKNQDILSLSDIEKIASLFIAKLRFTKIRLTGGEPLVRKDFFDIMKIFSKLKSDFPFTLGITTNGTLLKNNLEKLRSLGLDSLNISLDSLHPETFRNITQRDCFSEVFNAILRATELNFPSLKINTVVLRGINNNEIVNFVRFAQQHALNVRFIEYMPFSKNNWGTEYFIGYREMMEHIEREFTLTPCPAHPNDVSKDYFLNEGKTKISFITSISEHFCDGCNRLRITANGTVKACLFSTQEQEYNLKQLLHTASDNEIILQLNNILAKKWKQHPETEDLTAMHHNDMLSIGG